MVTFDAPDGKEKRSQNQNDKIRNLSNFRDIFQKVLLVCLGYTSAIKIVTMPIYVPSVLSRVSCVIVGCLTCRVYTRDLSDQHPSVPGISSRDPGLKHKVGRVSTHNLGFVRSSPGPPRGEFN